MNHAVNLSKPKIIFVSPMNLNKVTAVARKHTFIERTILYDNFNAKMKNFTGKPIFFSQIIDNTSNVNDFICKPQIMKENVAFILCSSGTTGLPKGVQLTQFNMLVGNVQFQ